MPLFATRTNAKGEFFDEINIKQNLEKLIEIEKKSLAYLGLFDDEKLKIWENFHFRCAELNRAL